jgi:hypothetical protein
VPAGWSHDYLTNIHCYWGLYRDSDSKVVVRYSICSLGFTDAVPCDVPGWAERLSGHSGPTPYCGYRLTSYREYCLGELRRFDLTAEEPDAESDGQSESALPPAGSWAVGIQFLVGYDIWSFEATICHANQERRLRDMLLRPGALNR